MWYHLQIYVASESFEILIPKFKNNAYISKVNFRYVLQKVGGVKKKKTPLSDLLSV